MKYFEQNYKKFKRKIFQLTELSLRVTRIFLLQYLGSNKICLKGLM